MAKPSINNYSDDEPWLSATKEFFKRTGIPENLPESFTKKYALNDLIRNILKVNHIDRGHVTCVFTVKPQLTNFYSTLHGGVVASVAEVVALASVRSVAGDKEFFLGESAVSYLSAAKLNMEVEVNAEVIRHGRRVVVSSVEFRNKETRQLIYTAQATFYNMPVSNL
ncbi:thioesterase superfamily protein [Tasmannia lanceolata]|uniref:thioesterase superfamily protein n=1 Tax=Tasmannia lanceolata TaxID=3420 RepID=UPI004063F2FC